MKTTIATILRSELLGRAGIFFTSNVISAAIQLLSIPILTRLLNPAQYGQLSIFVVIVSVLTILIGINLHGAINVFYFRVKERRIGIFIAAALKLYGVAFVLAIGISAIAPSSIVEFSGIDKIWLTCAIVIAGVQNVSILRLSLWQAKRNALHYGLLQVSISAANAALTIILIYTLSNSWIGRVYAQLCVVIVFGILSLHLLRKETAVKLSFRYNYADKKLLRFGVPLIPHSIGAIILASSGQVITFYLIDSNSAGLYAVAVQISAAVSLVADAFVKTYGPWLYHQLQLGSSESKQLIVGATYTIYLCFTVLGATAAGLTAHIAPYLLGSGYEGVDRILPILMFGNVALGMYYAVANLFFFGSNTKFISILSLTSGFAMLIMMVVLGIAFGVIGVALAFLLGQFMLLIMTHVASAKVVQLPWFEFKAAYTQILKSMKRQ